MIKHILIFFMFMYSNTTSIKEPAPKTCSAMQEFYYHYCLSTMSNEELELLTILSDENGIIYFNIYLDTCTLQIPVMVKDIFKEPDLMDFITTVTKQLEDQGIHYDEEI